MSFKQYLTEQAAPISWDALKSLEHYLDKLFNTLNMDVSFTKHFWERVNDARNKTQITLAELNRLFTLSFQKFGQKMKFMKPNSEAVLEDMSTDVNSPIVFGWNPVKRMMEIRAKTVMRKKNFMSPDPTLAVR